VRGVVSGAAEDFTDEFGDVLKVFGRHAREERSEQWVGGDLLVEARDESAQWFGTAEPFVECGNVRSHAGILARLWKPVFKRMTDA